VKFRLYDDDDDDEQRLCSVGFFAETSRKGPVVSRANSIGSTSASSVPNTGMTSVTLRSYSLKEEFVYIFDFDVHFPNSTSP